MLRRYTLLFSFILFFVGVVFVNNSIEIQIVSFINTFLHLHLDVVFRSFGLFYCGILFITLSLITGLLYLSCKQVISQRRFYLFSSALLVIFYFFFLWKDAINVPITDDYKILVFLDQYIHASAFAEKWQLIVQPVNECRIIVPKLYFLAMLKIFGGINFKWLIMVNGCILLVICFILFKHFLYRQNGIFQLVFLFLILQFQSFDLALWTIAAVCHYLVFLFVMLSVKAILGKSPYYLYTALLFALLASFTFGNGLLAFPIGCLTFIYQGRIKQAVFFAIAMVAIYAVYFYWMPYSKSHWEFNLPDIIIYVLAFLGSATQFMYALYIPVLTGFLIMGVFIYATIKKQYINNPFRWAMLLFIIMTAFVTAPFRLQWSPLEPRYGLYSIAAIVICLMMTAKKVIRDQTEKTIATLTSKSNKVYYLVLTAAICYNFISGIMFYPEAPVRRIKLQNFVNDWNNGKTVVYSPPVIPDEAEKYLDEAKKSGIWNEE